MIAAVQWSAKLVAVAALLFGTLGFCEPDRPVSSAGSGGASSPGSTTLRGFVEGRVTAASGAPIPNALVQPTSLSQPPAAIPEIAVVTDSQGHYRWSLIPGDYELAVMADGYQFTPRRVTVVGGQTVTLDFAANP